MSALFRSTGLLTGRLLPVFCMTVVVAASLSTSTRSAYAAPFDAAAESVLDYREQIGTPQAQCKRLTTLTSPDLAIVEATLITEAEVAYCRVRGVIPLEIRFEITLPTQWNGRFYMYGNGGLAGTPPEDESRRSIALQAMEHGFATAYTDTGHDSRVETGGTFAHGKLHKLIDYGFRAVHLTSTAAKEIIQAYYAQPANYSYFQGCSTGGRQAMISAQRFPDDFDGILAGAPAADYSGLKFAQAWRSKALIDKPFREQDVERLAQVIYAKCDGIDGLVDGLIDDPRACPFDVQKDLPKCARGEEKNCFTQAQVSALETYYAPVKLAGQQVYPAHPVGSEIPGPAAGGAMRTGWVPWLLNEQGRTVLDLLGSDFFRYMAFVADDAEYNWTEFDFASVPDNIEEFRAIVDALDPDLRAFHERGGKLISYFGWADPDINPLTAIDYFDAVAGRMPIDEFYRLYMVPGLFHCRGGPGFEQFDLMSPLINWVENGVRPDAVVAHRTFENAAQTRPLCPHPQKAHYKGKGDPAQAASFECRK
ncbi:MAG: tannase/feruloyl esterase family alpha/beta hydrolase [Proteobacteria bacterium]|nr:tannase/feruloyl esterase family alpha/beta hydrolase [Pseudomonadota bacterium]